MLPKFPCLSVSQSEAKVLLLWSQMEFSRTAMQGRSLRQFPDSDEYAVEAFTFTHTVCGGNSMLFGMLPDKVLSLPIMRIEQITFFSNFICGD